MLLCEQKEIVIFVVHHEAKEEDVHRFDEVEDADDHESDNDDDCDNDRGCVSK